MRAIRETGSLLLVANLAARDAGPALEALEAVANSLGASSGLLFEPAPPSFVITATRDTSIPTERVEVTGDSLLIRWLRVNGLPLTVPDDLGIWTELSRQEQAVLGDLDVNLAVPLVWNDELVAWAGLRTSQPHGRHDMTQIAGIARGLWVARASEAEQHALQTRRRVHGLTVAGQMAAGIAHEVRNPLAAVRSMVQLIQAGTPTPADRDRMFASILQEIDRANSALTSILTLGRPVSSREELVDLASVARQAAEFCAAYAGQQGLSIAIGLPERLPVLGDGHELRQAFINVILNACQASASGGVIRVESDPAASAARIRIVDAGSGMTADVLGRACEPFFTTKRDGGGLGLALCQAAVRRHGGDLSIISTPGHGTTVTFDVPLITTNGPTSRH